MCALFGESTPHARMAFDGCGFLTAPKCLQKQVADLKNG